MDAFLHPTSQRLRAVALSLPETAEGTSCVNRAFKVRKKNFLFLGEKDGEVRLMAKLVESLPDVQALADPRVDVGRTGWVTARFDPEDPPDVGMLERWVVESFRALAPKAVVRALDAEAGS